MQFRLREVVTGEVLGFFDVCAVLANKQMDYRNSCTVVAMLCILRLREVEMMDVIGVKSVISHPPTHPKLFFAACPR